MVGGDQIPSLKRVLAKMEHRFFDDALIKKYLLGDISHEAQERIEQRVLIDEEFSEELSMTRTEMVDDYVAGNLSAKERGEFEKHFLSTPEHVQMIEIGRALAKRLEDRSRDLVMTGSSASPPYYVRHLNAIISLTACAVLVVTAYVAWEMVQQRQPNSGANEAQERRAILENELGKLNRPATGSSQSAFAVVPLTLKPILVRDLAENRSVAISKSPSIIELRLELPGDVYHSYRASLQTGEGVELAVIDSLMARTTSNGKVVFLELPSWLMRPGSYQIKLTGISPSGSYEDIGLYPFEITN
jgi:hypothetical protein